MKSVHQSVLLHEVVGLLVTGELVTSKPVTSNQQPVWFLDGTLGGAGHSRAIAEALGGRLNLIGLDLDPEALKRDEEVLKPLVSKLILENESFRNLDKVLAKNGLDKVDLILLDLGYSSDQLENSGRGFSFQKDEPLLMTLGDPKKHPFTAKDILNKWDEGVIADVIFGYGEERYARRIARAVTNYRVKKPLETTHELVEIIRSAVPAVYRRGKIHPATKTFQALRIAVNDELNALKEGLAKGYESLNVSGRIAVIAFHSLEDRIVKDFFRQKARDEGVILVTKKPVTASEEEIEINPRSRSAKLRVIEKAGSSN